MFRTRRFQSPAIFGAAAGGGGTFTPTSTQSGNFLTRVAAVTGGNNTNHYGLSTNECTAIDTMITGIINDFGGNTSLSTWPILDALYYFKTLSSGVAVLNLVQNNFNLTFTGSTPTFTTDVGFTTAAGTDLLETSFNASTATSPNFTSNSAHMSLWKTTNTNGTACSMGADVTHTHMFTPYIDGNFYGRVNDNAAGGGFTASANFGHFLANRSTSSAVQLYQNGSSLGSNTSDTSTTVTNATFQILRCNGSATNIGDNFLAASIGGSLTGTQAGNLFSRLSACNSSIP